MNCSREISIMRNVVRCWGCICLAFVVANAMFIVNAYADPKFQDFYFQQHQRRFGTEARDGRMFAMAGSTSLVSRNSVSAGTNPAGLGLMEQGDVSAVYGYNEVSGNVFPTRERVKDKQHMGQIFGAIPLGPVKDDLPDYGNLAIGWKGDIGDWKGDPTDTESRSHEVTGAYAAAIGESASMGYSLTYLNDKVEFTGHDYDATESFIHRLGVQYRDTEDLIFGATASFAHGSHDLSHKEAIGIDQTVDHFGFGIGLGAQYTMDATSVAFGADYNYYDNKGVNQIPNDTVWGGDAIGHAMNFKVGFEQLLQNWLALRAGYRYAANFSWNYKRPDLDSIDGGAKYNAWSLGAGLRLPLNGSNIQEIRLDYGVEYRAVGRDDWEHLISLVAPFDICLP